MPRITFLIQKTGSDGVIWWPYYKDIVLIIYNWFRTLWFQISCNNHTKIPKSLLMLIYQNFIFTWCIHSGRYVLHNWPKVLVEHSAMVVRIYSLQTNEISFSPLHTYLQLFICRLLVTLHYDVTMALLCTWSLTLQTRHRFFNLIASAWLGIMLVKSICVMYQLSQV